MCIGYTRPMPRVEIPCPDWDASNAVYIMTNRHRTTLYIGVTSDICKRITEHRSGIHRSSFTRRYNLDRMVYVELYSSIEYAIRREKQLKGWRRERKIALIERLNPEWIDLGEQILQRHIEIAGV